MNSNKSSYKINIAMFLSLLGLIAFFSYWLWQTYCQEKEQLRRDSNFILMTSVRSVEDSLIKQSPWRIDDVSSKLGLHTEDSVKMSLRVVYPHDSMLLKSKLGSPIKKRAFRGEQKRRFPGMIGYFALDNLTTNKGATVSDRSIPDDVISLLTASFERRKIDLDFPVPAQILVIQDSIDQGSFGSSHVYHDIMTGTKARVSLGNYRGYLLMKMFPRLLISLGIIFVTMLSFYLLNKNLRRQKRLMEERAGLVANITHELNTPITSANLALEALQSREMSTQNRNDYLALAQGEIGRLASLVDKILVGVSPSGQKAINWTEIDLVVMTKEIIESMKLAIENNNGTVEFLCDENNLQIHGDSLQISGAIRNLIDNALKYSQPKPRIVIELSKERNDASFAITDNGVGIDTKYRNEVFEPFYRIPTGNIHDVKGHGLGLSFVKNVIEQHDGRIELIDTKDEGTTLRFKLPLMK